MADEAANSVMLERKDAKITIVRPFNVIAPIQSDQAGFVFSPLFSLSIFWKTNVSLWRGVREGHSLG